MLMQHFGGTSKEYYHWYFLYWLTECRKINTRVISCNLLEAREKFWFSFSLVDKLTGHF